jgi:hypothetical protein
MHKLHRILLETKLPLLSFRAKREIFSFNFKILLSLVFLFTGIASTDARLLYEKDVFGNSPYVEAGKAIRKNKAKALKKIIATKDFDLNYQGKELWASYGTQDAMTLLNWAVFWDSYDCAVVLLEAGADINKSNSSGTTPLIMTSYLKKGKSSDKLFELFLIKYKADPNRISDVGAKKSALAFVLQQRHLEEKRFERAEQLLQHGADIDLDLDRGKTALILLTDPNQYDVVLWLLEHGANYEARNKISATMMDYLKQDYELHKSPDPDRDKVRDWLIAHGVDPSRMDPAVNPHSTTFLMFSL